MSSVISLFCVSESGNRFSFEAMLNFFLEGAWERARISGRGDLRGDPGTGCDQGFFQDGKERTANSHPHPTVKDSCAHLSSFILASRK